MSVVASPPNSERISRPGKPKLWTVEEYLDLCKSGFIKLEDRVELLEGEIIEKMPKDFPHIDGVTFLVEALRAILGVGYHTRSQFPQMTSDSVPEPDVLVLRGSHRDYAGRYPTPEEIVLVAEVSNTTLDIDRKRKTEIYARAAFAEYWILNVVDRQLEVHRKPLSSGAYAEIRILGPDESVEIEGRSLKVADLLP